MYIIRNTLGIWVMVYNYICTFITDPHHCVCCVFTVISQTEGKPPSLSLSEIPDRHRNLLTGITSWENEVVSPAKNQNFGSRCQSVFSDKLQWWYQHCHLFHDPSTCIQNITNENGFAVSTLSGRHQERTSSLTGPRVSCRTLGYYFTEF